MAQGILHTYGSNTWAYNDTIVGPDGAFYATFRESTTEIAVVRWDAGSSSWQTYASFTAADAGDATFSGTLEAAFDSSGQLHVLFRYDEGGGIPSVRGVGHAEFDGVNWTFSEIDESSHSSGWHNFSDARFVLDAEGDAHVAYKFTDSSTHTYYIYYATDETGSWNPTEIQQSTATGGTFELHLPSVVLDAVGQPTITYIDEDGDNNYTGDFVVESGSSWPAPQVLVDKTVGANWFSETKTGDDGGFHTFYATGGTLHELTNVSGSWLVSTAIDGSGTAPDISYAIDYQEVGGIEYLLAVETGGDAFVYYRPDGGSWTKGSQAFAGIDDTSMAINASNEYMITYQDDLGSIEYLSGTASAASFPTASVSATNVEQADAGDTAYSFSVTYSDADGTINSATLGAGDVSVSKGGQSLPVMSHSWDSGTSTATYEVIPAGGDWDDADNGTWTIAINGSEVEDNDGNAVAADANAGSFTVSIDTTAPAVTSVSVPANGTYAASDSLDFTVSLSENTTVNSGGGTPGIAVTIGSDTVYADYVSGSGSSALIFRHTLAGGRTDADGIEIGSTIALNGGTIKDSVGNDATLALANVGSTGGILVDAVAPSTPPAPFLDAASDTGGSSTDGITSKNTPTISGTAEAGTTVTIISDTDGTLGTTTADSSGNWTFAPSTALSDNVHTLTATAEDSAGNMSPASSGLSITIDTLAPAAPSAPALDAASDTGAKGDDITWNSTPVLTGTGEANALVEVTSDIDGILGTATADGSGDWSFTPGVALSHGDHMLSAVATDAAGNHSASSAPLALSLVSAPSGGGSKDPEPVPGTEGSDAFVAGDTPQQFEGGAGEDTVTYPSSSTGMKLLPQPDGTIVVERPDGTRDIMVDIEHVQFGDKRFDFTVADQIDNPELADQVIELYVAYFNRVPEASGLLYWLDQIKNGLNLDQTANAFFDAALQYGDQTGYGPESSSEDLITTIYTNVLGRAGDTAPTGEEIEYWRDQLDSGEVTKYGLIARMLGDARDFSEDPDWGWVSALLDNKLDLGHTHAITFGVNYSSPEDAITNTHDYMGGVSPEGNSPALDLVGVSLGELEA